MKSLNTKLWLGFISVFVIFAIIFIGSMILNFNRNVVTVTNSISEALVDSKTQNVGLLIEEYIREIEVMSEMEVFESGDLDRIKLELVRRSKLIHPDFLQLFYADETGINHTSLGYSVDISDREHFWAVFSGAYETFVSDPIVLRSTGEKTFVITSAVKKDDAVIAVVGASINMNRITEIASSLSIGENGYGWIVDKSGLVVSHPDKSKIMSVNVFENDDYGMQTIQDAIISGNKLSGEMIVNNGNAEYMYTQSIPGTPNWTFCFSISKKDADSSINAFIRSFVISMFALALVMVFAVRTLSRKITKPLMSLDLLMSEAANGNLDVYHDYEGTDEIGRMSKAFNQMIIALKKSISGFKSANEELMERNDETQALYEEMMASENALKDNYDELNLYKNQIEYLAYHNSRTGLFNKEYLVLMIEEWLNENRNVSLILISFKELIHYMETLDQHIMDLLHTVMGKHLEQTLDSIDHLGIYDIGIGKYILAVESGKKTLAEDLFKKLKSNLLKVRIMEGTTIKTSLISGGYDVNDPNINPENMIRYAEIAKSKNTFETEINWFNEQMYTDKMYRSQLESDLHHAERIGELYVVYQPVYGQDGQIKSAEALVRWNHRSFGQIPPDVFVPLAENTGNIELISIFVIEQVFKFKSILQNRHNVHIPVAINVSFFEFINPDFIEILNKRATFYEIPKNEIVLEVTETAFSTHMDLAKDNLLKLMASGYQIHLDDFGTGYSSLFYLNRFPVNALKIDREFTNQYLQDKKSQEIIKSILDLAFKLDMAVVAEGVETEEQFNALKAVNCTFFQGYFFSKPIDGETFIELIAHQLNKDI